MTYDVDEQGRRRYHSNPRSPYTPVPDEQRKNKRRKPDDPRAVRFGDNWFLPLELLDPSQRQMPETIPDSASKGHKLKCRCYPCRRPGGKAYEHAEKIRRAREARAASAAAAQEPGRR